MKVPIQSVEVTYLVHATEDPERIGASVSRLTGVPSEPGLEHLEGHFGNKITKARVRLTGDDATRAFQNMVALMPHAMRKSILADIASFLDEHSALFLRLDKQFLVSGSLALGSRDSIRVKVKPRVFLIKGGAPGFYSKLMGGA